PLPRALTHRGNWPGGWPAAPQPCRPGAQDSTNLLVQTASGRERMERRLAAILAADVVGYSRLMEHDEAGHLAALKSRRREILQPAVSKHRGRVVKLMGDGALVEFGSAVNAVACAVELQASMENANAGVAEDQRIVLRVGINLGDVMVEGSDLYGDGVKHCSSPGESLGARGNVHFGKRLR